MDNFYNAANFLKSFLSLTWHWTTFANLAMFCYHRELIKLSILSSKCLILSLYKLDSLFYEISSSVTDVLTSSATSRCQKMKRIQRTKNDNLIAANVSKNWIAKWIQERKKWTRNKEKNIRIEHWKPTLYSMIQSSRSPARGVSSDIEIRTPTSSRKPWLGPACLQQSGRVIVMNKFTTKKWKKGISRKRSNGQEKF